MNGSTDVHARASGRFRRLVFAMACLGAAAVTWQSARGGDSVAATKADIPQARFLSALDLAGRAHRIGNGEGYRAVALVFITTECPIAREYVPELNRIAASLADKPARFYGVISEPGVTRAAADKFQKEFKIEFPILFDASGELAGTFKPTHVPEAFVLDKNAQVVYRGRIDDQYGEVGKKRPAATTHDLADAFTAILDDKPVAVARTTPVGCLLETKRPAGEAAKATYNRDIAPILFANCAECHRPGEVAPFSLLSYDNASKRAEFLADVTRDRLMPPWKAEIGHGRFLGERHLTDKQIELIAAWAKAGAPEGDAADLPPQPQFASGWRLGKPDLELKAPAPFTVHASGEDVFQHYIIPLDLPENKMVVGYEFRPGNPSVVHHAILFLDNSGVGRRKDAETPEPGYTTFGSIGIPVAGIIGVWTPGMTPRYYPQNAGMPVRKGTDLVLQLHMHPTGKEETDQSTVALYFADKPVDRTMSRNPFVVGSILIDIPAGSRDHTVTSSVTLPADVTLISLLPHMHLIGKEMKLTATLPDGKAEDLIWIKDWNFYWQDNYVFHEPVKLPAGTRLDVTSRYDNSEENPLNPSKPPERVLFGNGSTQEMCFGIFQLVVDQPSQERQLAGALMQTLLRDWTTSKLDNEARAKILDEAGKLFGGRGGEFGALLGGRRGQGRPGGDRDQPGPDQQKQ
ncbi:MAG: redoxin domain-containing protein [Planctomycetia bacterium]|nr:redoxin domain-containing protein [Planctomycetia bacterium]